MSRLKRSLRKRYVRWFQPSTLSLDGVRLTLDRRVLSPRMIQGIAAGLYEAPEAALLEATLVPEDRYLEVGAGIGLLGVIAARRIRNPQQVRLVEANPDLVRLIRANLELNSVAATVEHAAAAVAAGTIEFFLHEDFVVASTVRRSATRIEVPARAFADLLREVEPTYVMMDIEGGERELLLHDRLPDCVRKLCVELHPDVYGEDAATRIVTELCGQGFRIGLPLKDGTTFVFKR